MHDIVRWVELVKVEESYNEVRDEVIEELVLGAHKPQAHFSYKKERKITLREYSKGPLCGSKNKTDILKYI